MPTCAVHPSQLESPPLSQHAMSERSSQHSFGGGLAISAAVPSSLQDAHKDVGRSGFFENAERQEVPENSDGDESQDLDFDEAIDKLIKMLRMRGKSVQQDLLAIMQVWLLNLCKAGAATTKIDEWVFTIEDFIRLSGIKSAADLMNIDDSARLWWPSDANLDPKKAAVLELLHTTKADNKAKGPGAKSMDASIDNTKGPEGLLTPAVSPIKTQADVVQETPESSLEGDRGANAPCNRFSSSAPSNPIQGTTASADHAKHKDAVEGLAEVPGPAVASPPSSMAVEDDGPSLGEKREREGDGESRLQHHLHAYDEKVESHKRTAEHSYTIYHDLMAKRQRLAREVENAKQLEKMRRDLAKQLEEAAKEKDAKEQEVKDAALALEEAQKKLSAAQHAKHTQSAFFCGLKAQLKEVMHDKKESNDKLTVLTEEFHVLLDKNKSP